MDSHLLASLVLAFVALCSGVANIVAQRHMRAAWRRERELQKIVADQIATIHGATDTITTLTASLNKSNDTVEGLLAEKRAAWGLEAQRLRWNRASPSPGGGVSAE